MSVHGSSVMYDCMWNICSPLKVLNIEPCKGDICEVGGSTKQRGMERILLWQSDGRERKMWGKSELERWEGKKKTRQAPAIRPMAWSKCDKCSQSRSEPASCSATPPRVNVTADPKPASLRTRSPERSYPHPSETVITWSLPTDH